MHWFHPAGQDVRVSESPAASGWQSRRRALFDEYERVALVLFAERGFRSVTIEEVAEAAGVSARTLFRYFPTKDDYLLAFARRELDLTRDAIAALAPHPSPLPAVWSAVWARFEEADIDLDALTLWRAAASEAPDVVNRVRGERQEALIDLVSAYCAVSLGVDAARDVRPRLYGGIIAGADMALIELWGRSELTRPELTAAAEALFRVVAAAF
jgi:AcrR family transcriptional regulator